MPGIEHQTDACHLPFIKDESGNFYIFTSEIASHFKALANSDGVSLMFVSGEMSKMGAEFSMQRCKIHCQVNACDLEDKEEILMGFKNRYGEIVDTLRQFKDFVLFQLVPKNGVFIRGFGQAYKIDEGQVLPHVKIGG